MKHENVFGRQSILFHIIYIQYKKKFDDNGRAKIINSFRRVNDPYIVITVQKRNDALTKIH